MLAFVTLICVPVAEMREEPQGNSRIASSAMYGEEVTILEEKQVKSKEKNQDWVKIATKVDNHVGWVLKNVLLQKNESIEANSSDPIIKVNRNCVHIFDREDTEFGPILTLPFECKLKVIGPLPEPDSRWLKVSLLDGQEGYIQRGDITFDLSLINRDQMCELSKQFLGLPYTWGGRSSFGYDCSGFTQMLYRQMGIYLEPVSQKQMRWEGFTEISLEKIQAGDLIFFGYAEDKIRHVGMALNNNEFIHPCVCENMPWVRISRLTDHEWNGNGLYKYRAARTLRAIPDVALRRAS